MSFIHAFHLMTYASSPLPLLPPLLLPIISLRFLPLLPLNFRNKPLILLLIRLILLLLLPQILSRNNLPFLPQLPNRPLLLPLKLLPQLRGFRAFLVRIIVFVGVKGLFEFGDRGLDRERFVMV